MASALNLGVDDVVDVLTGAFGIEGQVHGREFRMLCPSHEDTHPSCGVNVETGYWNCWSCDAGGDLIDLGHVVLHKSRKSVKDLLKIKDPSLQLASAARIVRERARATKTSSKPSWRPVVPSVGSYERGPLAVLRARGFTNETLKRWGVRFVRKEMLEKVPDSVERGQNPHFEIADCFAIPVVDEKDECRMWVYGRTATSPGWMPKYLNTPGVDKQELWWGLQHHAHESEIAVCEGILDAMWCDQWGIPAVANLGTNLKNEQENIRKIERLCQFPIVTLFMDNDPAGLVATRQLGEMLHARGVAVRIVRYKPWMLGRDGKPAKDPQDLDRLDLQLSYWRAIPYVAWRVGA